MSGLLITNLLVLNFLTTLVLASSAQRDASVDVQSKLERAGTPSFGLVANKFSEIVGSFRRAGNATYTHARCAPLNAWVRNALSNARNHVSLFRNRALKAVSSTLGGCRIASIEASGFARPSSCSNVCSRFFRLYWWASENSRRTIASTTTILVTILICSYAFRKFRHTDMCTRGACVTHAPAHRADTSAIIAKTAAGAEPESNLSHQELSTERTEVLRLVHAERARVDELIDNVALVADRVLQLNITRGRVDAVAEPSLAICAGCLQLSEKLKAVERLGMHTRDQCHALVSELATAGQERGKQHAALNERVSALSGIAKDAREQCTAAYAHQEQRLLLLMKRCDALATDFNRFERWTKRTADNSLDLQDDSLV